MGLRLAGVIYLYLQVRKFTAICMVFVLFISLATGCAGQKPQVEPVKPTAAEVEKIDEFALLQKAAHEYVQKPARLIEAKELYEKVVVPKNTGYMIISTRTPEDYAKGHIEGAVRITRTEFAQDEAFTKLQKDKRLVLYCYTGSGAAYVATMLNLMGYDAVSMKFGYVDWTSNPEVLATSSFPKPTAAMPMEQTTNVLSGSNLFPVLETGGKTVADIAKARGKVYFRSGKPRNITADELKRDVYDEKKSGYLILDLRSPQLYARGHLPGSYNIPYADSMKLENLKKIPRGKTLVIVSEDGQNAMQASALYNFLGYNSVALLYGMLSWTDDTDLAGAPSWPGAHNYPWVGTAKP